MKLIAPWTTIAIVAAFVAAFGAGSCSIRHASDVYECAKQADCTGGRTCSDGYCVIGPGGLIDAPRPVDAPGTPDARTCPPQCSSCNVGQLTCKIDCAVTSCTGAIVCPPGWNCDVLCTTANSCRNGVNCAGTLSCDIDCAGDFSCRNVLCGGGRCSVKCAGTGSCNGVQCGTSCACDVSCGGGALCTGVTCSHFVCNDTPGCSSSNSSACDTCP